jgi:translation initiation factor 1
MGITRIDCDRLAGCRRSPKLRLYERAIEACSQSLVTMQKSPTLSNWVYSSETGRICPDCSQPVAQCQCAANKKALAAAGSASPDGIVRVQRETKGRGGKSVTLVRGLALNAEALAALGKQLKAACGSGGTVKDGVIELQGDHVLTLVAALEKRGYKVKRVGG